MRTVYWVVFREAGFVPLSLLSRLFGSVVVCALLLNTAAAQQETLGSILDQGAKRMSSAEIRAAVAAGSLANFPAGSLQSVSYDSDGSMSGFSPDGGFWINGEWTIDDLGKQCFDWAGWGQVVCYFWFKQGESIYLVSSESESNRDGRVLKLEPR